MMRMTFKRVLAKLAGGAALAAGLTLGASSAFAVAVVWDLGCATTPLCQNTFYTSPHPFQSIGPPPNPFTLNTFGFDPGNTAHNLFSKFTSGDPTETGLGLQGPPDNEINFIGTGQYVDLVHPTAAGLSTMYQLIVSSVQAGEGFQVFGSNTTGAGSLLGTLLGSTCGTVVCTFNLDLSTFSTVAVRATAGDVLIEAFTTTATIPTPPEPATLALLGLGMFAAGLARRRKL